MIVDEDFLDNVAKQKIYILSVSISTMKHVQKAVDIFNQMIVNLN